jgi:hypothetical protein
VGPERLIAPSLALLLAACSGTKAAEPAVGTSLPAVAADRRHVQFARIAPPAERLALLDRLRKNAGPSWVLGKQGSALDDVDPIRVFLRRAWRVDPVGAPATFTRAEAESDAILFVNDNAELLGLSRRDVVALDVITVPVPKEHEGHAMGVRFGGKIPMRGYEAFDSLASTIDLVVFVDVDRQIRHFLNLSRVHPRLSIDTRPLLDAEDPTLLHAIVGRELSVIREPAGKGKELLRESLGKASAADVVGRQLTVHVSNGPIGAYVAYHLAYAVVVVRRGHRFTFVVSADSGDLLEDAEVPIARQDPSQLL